MDTEKDYQRKLKAVVEKLLSEHRPAIARDMQVQGHDITAYYLLRMTKPDKKGGIKRPNAERVQALHDYFFE